MEITASPQPTLSSDKAAIAAAAALTFDDSSETISLAESGLLDGIPATTAEFTVKGWVEATTKQVLYGDNSDLDSLDKDVFSQMMINCKSIVLVESCNSSSAFQSLPIEAKQVKITNTLTQVFPDCSYHAVQSHKLPRLIVEMTSSRLMYLRKWVKVKRNQAGNMKFLVQKSIVISHEGFNIQLHVFDPFKVTGIDIKNFVELNKFKEERAKHLIFVPDLPSSYPDRYIKTAMVGLFKGVVEVMAFIRPEGVRFAAVSNEEMRRETYTANTTGVTFIVSQEDLAKVIST